MDVRMPDGTIIRGVPPGTTKAELDEKLARHRQTQVTAPEPGKMFDKPEGYVDPTEGMSYGEKALANVGAGLDTTWQGAKQLVGQGVSDEELRAKRKRDKALADATFGGGVIQTVGELLPTIPLGLGAGALAARGVLGAAGAAAGASPTISAALGGATAGALMPTTEDESKLLNTGLGAVTGGLSPHVLKLALKGARGAGQVAERAAAALPGRVGEAASERVGLRRTQDLLRRELPQGIPDQDVYTPHAAIQSRGGQPSAAMATQSPEIAGLERASRTMSGPEWQAFDEAQQAARWRTMDEGLQSQADVDRLLGEANQIGRQTADVYAAAGPAKFDREMDRFYEALQQAKESNVYHASDAVRGAVDYIESTMAKAGTVTPELVHLMKRELGQGLPGRPGVGEAGVRAASKEPKILDLMKSLDNVLENATRKRGETSGKYSQWKEAYGGKMTEAEAAKADVNIRSKFIDPATGMAKKMTTSLDGEPLVTGGGLRQAMAQYASAKRGPKKGQNLLTPSSQTSLEAVARDLDAADIIKRSKAASTGGSGSDTASNMAQAAMLEALLPTGFGIGRLIKQEGDRKAQAQMHRQLAALLQNPGQLRRFLRAAEQQRLLRGQTPMLPGGAGAAMPLMLGGPRE